MKNKFFSNNLATRIYSEFAGCRILYAMLLLGATSAVTYASEPFALTSTQLDKVSAGNADIAASAQGTANAISDSAAIAGVKTSANADSRIEGHYRLDAVTASGISYACCDGGDTTLEINVSSNAEKQFGFVKIYQLDSSLVSIKIGGGGIVGISSL